MLKLAAAGPPPDPEDNWAVFQASKESLPEKTEEVSLMAVGDIMLSRYVAKKIKKLNDLHYPFVGVRDSLRNAEIVFGNLEGPITAGREIRGGEMVLRADPGIEQALQAAGFNILSLANNHMLDFGSPGLQDTQKYLKQAGIKGVGAGRDQTEAYAPVLHEEKGIRFAFLAFSERWLAPASVAQEDRPGIAAMDLSRMIQAVAAARSQADFVIVSMHAGQEYSKNPDHSQINFAHQAIEAGADLVLGHHPHVLQKLEKYQQGFIFYSLGNFIFDQYSPPTKEGMIAKISFNKKKITAIAFLPVVITEFCKPIPREGERGEDILERLEVDCQKEMVLRWDQEAGAYRLGDRKVLYNGELNFNAAKLKKMLIPPAPGQGSHRKCLLQNGRLRVYERDLMVWESSPQWWVDDFALADVDGDGIVDLNLSLWKVGSYGRFLPFWLSQNDQQIRNHFFIFTWRQNGLKPLWHSSSLGRPNVEFALADLDQDGKAELVVLEGNYSPNGGGVERQLAIWKWNGWGFSQEWTGPTAKFRHLRAERYDGGKQIVLEQLH